MDGCGERWRYRAFGAGRTAATWVRRVTQTAARVAPAVGAQQLIIGDWMAATIAAAPGCGNVRAASVPVLSASPPRVTGRRTMAEFSYYTAELVH